MSAFLHNRPSFKAPIRLLLAAVAATTVAACQGERITTGSVETTLLAQHQGQVAPEHVVLDLPATSGRMNRAERGAVHDFVQAYRRDGQGPLEILGPRGNDSRTELMVGEVRQVAIAGGLPPSSIHYSPYYSKDAHAPVVMRYQRYVAHVGCGQWPSDVGTDWRNVPYENFGCATQSNLAAMVEDPRDLVAPRPMTPRDSERRDVVFDNYRRGQPTGARTGSDDAGTATSVGP